MTEHRLAPTFRLISHHLPEYGRGFEGVRVIAACSCGEKRPADGYGGWWAWHLAHALDDAALPTPPVADLLAEIGEQQERAARNHREALRAIGALEAQRVLRRSVQAELDRQTASATAALNACHRDAVPKHVVGEALLGYWAAQEHIRGELLRAGQP
jgi:hypothetical protein